MQAVILAAGCGSRLKEHNKGKPKALIQLDKARLIEYQISILQYFGIDDICIVIGYEGDIIRSVLGNQYYYINNSKYADTNSLYSLWLARKWVNDDLIIINSDVLAHPNIFWHLLITPGNALVYDSSSELDAESMKIEVTGNKLRHISKSISVVNEPKGESLGILKFQKKDIKYLFSQAEQALKSGGVDQWAPAAFERFCRKKIITCIDIAGFAWVEIDYAEDLLDATEIVWPEIEKAIYSPPYNQAFTMPVLTHPELT
jgi:choline kinase